MVRIVGMNNRFGWYGNHYHVSGIALCKKYIYKVTRCELYFEREPRNTDCKKCHHLYYLLRESMTGESSREPLE